MALSKKVKLRQAYNKLRRGFIAFTDEGSEPLPRYEKAKELAAAHRKEKKDWIASSVKRMQSEEIDLSTAYMNDAFKDPPTDSPRMTHVQIGCGPEDFKLDPSLYIKHFLGDDGVHYLTETQKRVIFKPDNHGTPKRS